jgi:very-short-patch-repair endonuclease
MAQGNVNVVKNIVIGQKVKVEKVECAKVMRRSMTNTEKVLWQILRANRFEGFHFRRQQVIKGFVVDFYCHAASLIIEVDGSVHNLQIEQDQERAKLLQELGLRVVRIRNEEVEQDLIGVLERIKYALQPLPSSEKGPGI